ncbi:MAG: peptidylprolyl isomerase [Armatimonadetes bacterium]|nr:peptidylprolyl isomerase [Armatimonadota bacterium]
MKTFWTRLALALLAWAALAAPAPARAARPPHSPVVRMVTTKGVILIKLFPRDAPITCANFEKLVRKGFYNGLTFHRYEPGFVIQGGDPNGNGSGGPGYTIKGEFRSNGVPNPLKHNTGAVAMARTDDPNSAGSQFYICLAPAPFLDDKYAVFGQVIKGQDVAEKLHKGDKMIRVTLTP